MKILEAIRYLSECNDYDFDTLRHLIMNLQTTFHLAEQEMVIAIACSDFWPMLIEETE